MNNYIYIYKLVYSLPLIRLYLLQKLNITYKNILKRKNQFIENIEVKTTNHLIVQIKTQQISTNKIFKKPDSTNTMWKKPHTIIYEMYTTNLQWPMYSLFLFL